MRAVLQELEAALGHGFASPRLLECALTHRSLSNERAANDARAKVVAFFSKWLGEGDR